MAFTVPAAANYASPLVLQVSNVTKEPTEGRRQVNCNVEWGNSAYSTLKAVNFNFQQNSTLALTQIVCLVVDNSDCGADVRFYFPDTQMTVTVPSYTPYAIVEVATSARSFILQTGINGQTVVSTDMTRFQVLNYLPPPVVIPTSQEQATAVVGNINMGTATTTLIASTVNGTLEAVNINLAFNSANSGDGTWSLEDGAGNKIMSGAVSTSSGDKLNLTLASIAGIRVRFSQGIVLKCTQTAVLGAVINTNLYYRKP